MHLERMARTIAAMTSWELSNTYPFEEQRQPFEIGCIERWQVRSHRDPHFVAWFDAKLARMKERGFKRTRRKGPIEQEEYR